jgi:hypothetical protein
MCTRTITEYCTRLTGGSVIVFIGAFRALLEFFSCVHGSEWCSSSLVFGAGEKESARTYVFTTSFLMH